MSRYEKKFYHESLNDVREGVRGLEGEVFVLCIEGNGSGLRIYPVEKHSMNEDVFWRAGSDEIAGIYDTYEEAEAYMEIYPEKQLPEELAANLRKKKDTKQ